MDFILDNLGVIIYATLLFTPPLLFAALGSCFSEVSGVINIGIEGMMVAGAFTGCTVTSKPGDVLHTIPDTEYNKNRYAAYNTVKFQK